MVDMIYEEDDNLYRANFEILCVLLPSVLAPLGIDVACGALC